MEAGRKQTPSVAASASPVLDSSYTATVTLTPDAAAKAECEVNWAQTWIRFKSEEN